MQDILSSTSSSFDHFKLTHIKSDTNLSEKKHTPGHQVHPENNNIHRKYTEFINAQNIIINETILDSKTKSTHNSMEEELANKLRDSSNQFIKNLLSELTEAYSKLRALKSSSEERIGQLECELVQEKSTSKMLHKQFYSSWQESSEQCEKYLQFIQKELKETVERYEQKISGFLKQIQKKQQYCDRIYCEKLQLNNQLSQLNRVLRMERQSLNEKHKQFKGMELLVAEYQTTIQDLEVQKQDCQNEIKELVGQVKQLQQYNKDLIGQLDQYGFITSQKEEEVKKLGRLLQQAKKTNFAYEQQIEHLKIKARQDATLQENNLILLKNNQTSLKLEIQQKLSRLSNCENQLENHRQQLGKSYEQIRKSKRDAKRIIAKVELMFKSKQKLIKKAFKLKLQQLRVQNQELKESISREIFKFYQQLRIDLLTNSIPESKSLIFPSQVLRA